MMDADDKLSHIGGLATANRPRAEIEAWMSGNGISLKAMHVQPQLHDRLAVAAVMLIDGDEYELAAKGWQSATSNHFDLDAYDPKTGHRLDDAKPRAMTDDEALCYCLRLLAEQNHLLTVTPAAKE